MLVRLSIGIELVIDICDTLLVNRISNTRDNIAFRIMVDLAIGNALQYLAAVSLAVFLSLTRNTACITREEVTN